MSLKDLVQQHEDRLTDADRRLIAELLSDPMQAAFLSTSDLAARAKVHEASATRLAQKLGFKGYPEFRNHLREHVLVSAEPAERIRRKLAQASGGDVLHSLVASELDALQNLPQYISQADLDAAARVIAGAERIYLFGRGHATSLVALLDRRLRRYGLHTVPAPVDGRDLAETVMGLAPGDAVVGFAFRREPRGLATLFEHARETGAKTILISGMVGAVIRPAPDFHLAAPRGRQEEFQSLNIPMVICNALILTIAKVDPARSMEALERLTTLIDRFESDEPIRQKGRKS